MQKALIWLKERSEESVKISNRLLHLFSGFLGKWKDSFNDPKYIVITLSQFFKYRNFTEGKILCFAYQDSTPIFTQKLILLLQSMQPFYYCFTNILINTSTANHLSLQCNKIHFYVSCSKITHRQMKRL